MTTVFDATVLLNFGRRQALWMIKQTFPAPRIVVEEVVAEILYPPEAVDELHAAMAAGWLRLHRISSDAEVIAVEELRQRTPRLGPGESASLAACLANGWAFASDDRDARRGAVGRGLRSREPSAS
jgi:predicted nucleic acid-binding protein